MKKNIIIALACVLFTGLFSFSAFSVETTYPDLTPEYLQSFAPGSKYIIESGQGSETARIYDGETGKFLFIIETNGTESQVQILKSAMQKAKQLGL